MAIMQDKARIEIETPFPFHYADAGTIGFTNGLCATMFGGNNNKASGARAPCVQSWVRSSSSVAFLSPSYFNDQTTIRVGLQPMKFGEFGSAGGL